MQDEGNQPTFSFESYLCSEDQFSGHPGRDLSSDSNFDIVSATHPDKNKRV